MPGEPLATRMRPRRLDDVVGQQHVLGEGSLLRQALDDGEPFSMIVWGPPGCGKTTLGFLVADSCDLPFHHLSAVTFSVKDVQKLVSDSEGDLWGGRMVLFLDEIHRLSKSQQDVLLPHVESGRIVLIGATTENPAFEVNRALLSRSRVFRLEPLSFDELTQLLRRAIHDEKQGLASWGVTMEDDAEEAILRYSGGDARAALNILETAARGSLRTSSQEKGRVTEALVVQAAGTVSVAHDKKGEEHYNVISAFIKSMRGGAPNAVVYYLARMVEGGEDPGFIARRIMICASEDVGLADPVPLMVATSAAQAVERVGMPEARIILSHAALTVCLAPKSNTAYQALKNAQQAVRQGHGRHPVPSYLRGAQGPQETTPKNYKYAHNYPGNFVEQQYLPDAIRDAIFYEPTDQGRERTARELLERWWGSVDAKSTNDADEPS